MDKENNGQRQRRKSLHDRILKKRRSSLSSGACCAVARAPQGHCSSAGSLLRAVARWRTAGPAPALHTPLQTASCCCACCCAHAAAWRVTAAAGALAARCLAHETAASSLSSTHARSARADAPPRRRPVTFSVGYGTWCARGGREPPWRGESFAATPIHPFTLLHSSRRSPCGTVHCPPPALRRPGACRLHSCGGWRDR